MTASYFTVDSVLIVYYRGASWQVFLGELHFDRFDFMLLHEEAARGIYICKRHVRLGNASVYLWCASLTTASSMRTPNSLFLNIHRNHHSLPCNLILASFSAPFLLPPSIYSTPPRGVHALLHQLLWVFKSTFSGRRGHPHRGARMWEHVMWR